MNPLFSVGITTYNRNDLLRECLLSVLKQDCADLEVIVGNDYQQQMLTEDILGIHDPRIKILNYPTNLGPIGNANFLLSMSTGRYFTLLADDDMHTRHYLRVMRHLLEAHNYPPCMFVDFTSDREMLNDRSTEEGDIMKRSIAFTGRDFLGVYLKRTIKTIGCYGVFEIEYLKQIGGMRQLGYDRSMYAEMPLVIASGLLAQVVYVNYPLVFFRSHEGSLSNTSTNAGAYASSQEALLQECMSILCAESLRDEFHANLFLLLKWFTQDFVAVMHRSGSINLGQVFHYIGFLRRYMKYFRGSPRYWKAIHEFLKIPTELVINIGKSKIISKCVSFKQWLCVCK